MYNNNITLNIEWNHYATGNDAIRSSVEANGVSVRRTAAASHAFGAAHAGDAGGTSASSSEPLTNPHPRTCRAAACNAIGAFPWSAPNGESHSRVHLAGVAKAQAGHSVAAAPSTVQPIDPDCCCCCCCIIVTPCSGLTSARLNGLVDDTPHHAAAAGLFKEW